MMTAYDELQHPHLEQVDQFFQVLPPHLYTAIAKRVISYRKAVQYDE